MFRNVCIVQCLWTLYNLLFLAGGHGSCQNFSQLPRMLSGRSIFRSHSKGLDEVLRSVQVEKYKQKKYVFNWDVVHLKFKQNLVKCKDRVINIAGRAVINAF